MLVGRSGPNRAWKAATKRRFSSLARDPKYGAARTWPVQCSGPIAWIWPSARVRLAIGQRARSMPDSA